ncbi:BTB/POZ domain and ankyrin repeat-containing protein NPR5-like isoform X2 [Musa acuminata AAA Group]|uniref:BTB/POZ domain and ankyrin repeat-containing protein NPR5-like isoform X2 n=2 Tax=Musa acuminata AAA Group TaxID=214697 RepID=UPI0031D05370
MFLNLNLQKGEIGRHRRGRVQEGREVVIMEETLKSLSLDYLNLLINGQAFSDVTFSVEGRLVHAHRCVLAARSLFFRRFFCGSDPSSQRRPGGATVIPVNSVTYEVFLLILQFLYSGQTAVVPQKHELRPGCGERGCWHTHCTAAVDLALDTLAAARSFGVKQLEQITEKQLGSMVEKASIEDVMRVLMAAWQQDMQQLWTTCSLLVAKSGLPAELLAKHLPFDVVARIEELRLRSSLARRPSFLACHHHTHPIDVAISSADIEDHHQKIRRMRRALDSSDVELVKLMVMGEGLNLDDALALHYAVENCSREVVKALLELGAADVNCPAGAAGKTPLHIAAEMVCPDMVAVLLDHHANPNIRTTEGVAPLDILRTMTSDFLFKGTLPGLSHVEPNKLRLCLELVQSAALVMSRDDANYGAGTNPSTAIYPRTNPETGACNATPSSSSMINLSLDSRMVYLNLGMAEQFGCKMDDNGGDESSPSSLYPSHGFP